jgi:hypothetical protein
MNGSYIQCGALRVPPIALAMVILISIDKNFPFCGPGAPFFLIFSCLTSHPRLTMPPPCRCKSARSLHVLTCIMTLIQIDLSYSRFVL